MFVNDMVLQQLRAAGMLETINIHNAGYPPRLTSEAFMERYDTEIFEKRKKTPRKQKNQHQTPSVFHKIGAKVSTTFSSNSPRASMSATHATRSAHYRRSWTWELN